MISFSGVSGAATRSSAARTEAKRARSRDQQPAKPEEVLVRDDRGSLRPAQMVERKLSGLLPGAFLRVSQLRFRGLINRR
jgi:hypothetical protein